MAFDVRSREEDSAEEPFDRLEVFKKRTRGQRLVGSMLMRTRNRKRWKIKRKRKRAAFPGELGRRVFCS
jgi:hypothetical protein